MSTEEVDPVQEAGSPSSGNDAPYSGRLRIYVSGPITGGPQENPTDETLQHNAEVAIDAAQEMLDMGAAPFCPHLSLWWERRHPGRNPHPVWIELDLPWVKVAEILVRLPGKSVGADMEVYFAEQHGIPVLYWPDERDMLAQYVQIAKELEAERDE